MRTIIGKVIELLKIVTNRTKYDPLKAVHELADKVKQLDRLGAERHAENVAVFGENCPDDAMDYFGGCPECGHNDGSLNIKSVHFITCHEHKVCWCVGSNLFSNWKEESEYDWLVNRMLLETYEEAKPIHSKTMLREFEAQAKERQELEEVPF